MKDKLVILDTETTGLEAKSEKIVEICCLSESSEILFYSKLNPCKAISKEAYKVHGLSEESLKDCTRFSKIKKELINAISDSTLVIHNAGFDLKFLYKEFLLTGVYLPTLFKNCNITAIDSLTLARKMKLLKKNRLDDLANYFKIDLDRSLHSAETDCKILLEVFKNLLNHSSFNESLLLESIYNVGNIKI